MRGRIRAGVAVALACALATTLAVPAGAAAGGAAETAAVPRARVVIPKARIIADAGVQASAMDPYEYFYDDLVYSYDNTYNGLASGTSSGSLFNHTFQTDDWHVMQSPTATERHDTDFHWMAFTYGHTYRIVASPNSIVPGADPVLYLYDPQNMTTDPPEVLRRCDDYQWAGAPNLGACFYYTATNTANYYFSVDDEYGTGYNGTKWVAANYTKGTTYGLQVIDLGVVSSDQPLAVDHDVRREAVRLRSLLARRRDGFPVHA